MQSIDVEFLFSHPNVTHRINASELKWTSSNEKKRNQVIQIDTLKNHFFFLRRWIRVVLSYFKINKVSRAKTIFGLYMFTANQKNTLDCDEMHIYATKPIMGRFWFYSVFFLSFLVVILTKEKKLHALEIRNEKKMVTQCSYWHRAATTIDVKFIIALELCECICFECAHIQNKYGVVLDCHRSLETSYSVWWGLWLFPQLFRAIRGTWIYFTLLFEFVQLGEFNLWWSITINDNFDLNLDWWPPKLSLRIQMFKVWFGQR